jgi:hypothetical protein
MVGKAMGRLKATTMRGLLLASALSLAALPAFAQTTATPTVPGRLQTGTGCLYGQATCYVPGTPTTPLQVLDTTFASTGSTTLSASTTTANAALPANGALVEVANGGTVTAYVNLGVGSGTTATSANLAIPGGQTVFLYTGSATYIAGITASSTATLTVTVGNLAPIGGSGGPTANVTCVSGCYQTTQPISLSPAVVTPTDRGGTITTGGTAQQLAAANASRKQLCVQNPPSATETLYLSTSTTATVAGAGNDAGLSPGAQWCAGNGLQINQNAVSVIATTTAHRWIATEF